MSALDVDVTPTSIRKVVGASMIGTTVEWYDFFLYGTAASLVFNKLFFPSYEPLVGTLLSFATYALGFLARPLGGIVFGHFGDKVGRKRMLVFSLALMGGATFAIGLLPTYGTIGIAAPILLVVLRMVQGFAVGGEWGGAVLMVAEHGDRSRRGFYSSWPQTGVPAGQLLGVLVLTVMSSTLSDEAFLSWGWRIPFLLSIVLVFIGLWIRNSVSESPVFRAAQEKAEKEAAENKAPLGIILRKYRREVLIAMGARFAENVSYYVFTLFVITYATQELGLKRTTVLNAVLIAAVVHFISIPVWGALSDRLGRRPLYLMGAVGVGVWAFVFFGLIDTKSFPVIALAISVGLFFHGAMYGPQAAFFSELFGTKARYTGASVGYQLASVFAGSLAPLIAVALLARYDSAFPVSLYMLGTVVITLLAVGLSHETKNRDLEADEGSSDLTDGDVPTRPSPVAPEEAPRMKTRAAVLEESGRPTPYQQSRPLVVDEVQLDGPGAGEALVRVTAAGLCHSDLSVVEGARPRPLPMVLGHEATGIVEEVGPGVSYVQPGDAVVFSFVPVCGACVPCQSGRPALCEPGAQANTAGTLLSGARPFRRGADQPLNSHLGVSGFAERTVSSVASLVKVPAALPAPTAALFGCALLTGVGAVLNTARAEAGSAVVVFGLGGVGLSAVMAARLAGCHPIVAVDRFPSKLDLAKRVGATAGVLAGDDTVAEIKDLTGGGADYAFEAAGNARVLESAYAATRRGGTTVSVGLPHPEQQMSFPAVSLVAEERRLVGSYMGSAVPRRDIPRYIALYQAGMLPVDELQSSTLSLDDINSGFDALAAGEVVRQLVVMGMRRPA